MSTPYEIHPIPMPPVSEAVPTSGAISATAGPPQVRQGQLSSHDAARRRPGHCNVNHDAPTFLLDGSEADEFGISLAFLRNNHCGECGLDTHDRWSRSFVQASRCLDCYGEPLA